MFRLVTTVRRGSVSHARDSVSPADRTLCAGRELFAWRSPSGTVECAGRRIREAASVGCDSAVRCLRQKESSRSRSRSMVRGQVMSAATRAAEPPICAARRSSSASRRRFAASSPSPAAVQRMPCASGSASARTSRSILWRGVGRETANSWSSWARANVGEPGGHIRRRLASEAVLRREHEPGLVTGLPQSRLDRNSHSVTIVGIRGLPGRAASSPPRIARMLQQQDPTRIEFLCQAEELTRLWNSSCVGKIMSVWVTRCPQSNSRW